MRSCCVGDYAPYRYRHVPDQKKLLLDLTGSGDHFVCHVLLPAGARAAKGVTCDGDAVSFETTQMESSRYVDFQLDSNAAARVVIEYELDDSGVT